MKFGENLKLIRKGKNISQEELAEKLGVSRQSISKWETGENYPTMTNILCLCDIFNCKINEIVHEDFTDINSLDDDIKMSVVKFKEKEQKRMKGLSKAIYICARIFKVVSVIGIVSSIILFIASIVVISNTKFDTSNQEVKIFNNEYTYKIEGRNIIIDNDNENIDFALTSSTVTEVEKVLNASTIYQTSFALILSASLFASCFCLFKMLKYLEKLFINIHDNDTPFSSDNVNYIKKIALYVALYIVIPDMIGSLAEIIFSLNLEIEINMIEYLFVVIIISIAYIFKYGCEIQLDSKGKIYGNENE